MLAVLLLLMYKNVENWFTMTQLNASDELALDRGQWLLLFQWPFLSNVFKGCSVQFNEIPLQNRVASSILGNTWMFLGGGV